MTKVSADSDFNFKDKVAAVTGGGGVLCSNMCKALGERGVKVAVLDISLDSASSVANQINQASGQAVPITCDVLNKESLENALRKIEKELGSVNFLINGAGGNKPQATTSKERTFFDLPIEAIEQVFALNVTGTFLTCQVFGRDMANRGEGTILNIASMNAFRPLTRVPGYSAAKAAVSNFTQWLAVHMAFEYSADIRVNALAPGFFLTEQNHYLLVNENSGNWTQRGQQILDHTPMSRFGNPDDLLGAMFWLLSPASAFVTGVVIPIDGGFSAYCGV